MTGGANGIGEAIARQLAADGYRITLWDLDTAALDRAAAALRASGAQVGARSVDIASLDGVRSAMNELVAEAGTPDVLVNCAGIHRTGSILESPPEDFDVVLRVNVLGTFNCCHVAVPLMVARQRGSIVNIAL